MKSTMNYLPKDKINIHLNLGRKVVCFLQIGEYFESKTFEYLEIIKTNNEYTIKMVQALDNLYSLSPSMEEFETVEDLENECNYMFTGSLDDCFNWATKKYNPLKNEWSLDIIDIYLSYVNKQILGQGSDHI